MFTYCLQDTVLIIIFQHLHLYGVQEAGGSNPLTQTLKNPP